MAWKRFRRCSFNERICFRCPNTNNTKLSQSKIFSIVLVIVYILLSLIYVKKVPEIQHFRSTFKEMTLFFGYSAKRKEILKTHLGKEMELSNFLADNVENEQEYISNNAAHRRTLPTLSYT